MSAVIQGKTVLVTGAASGLGLAIARRLLEAGAFVALLDRDADKTRAVAAQLDPRQERSIALAADVGDAQAVADAVAKTVGRFGALDVLVNNAGTDVTASLAEVDIGAWDKVLDTNLRGPFYLAKAALPALRASDDGRGGHIINIASTAALRAWPNASAYHASKWGLLGLSRALHAELRSAGIRVSSVIAGGMRTPFLLERFPDLDPNALQDPANVAEAVHFMLAMPRGSVVAEVMVLPDQETSWP
ncbi:MAG: short-chain dehydrogenase [Rhodoferax sp.]|nr:short-chain dehydrogenase [Rhodoferax sp.]